MWPFKKVKSLSASGIFTGFTDWHSHILPGVDDGVKSLNESLEILQEYENLGFKKVWLTPHIMEDYPNETAELKRIFEELKSNWKGDLEISLASENMLDTLFEERLEKNEFLPIGDEGKHLLIETSYYTPPFGMDEMIDKARKKGYHLILAHPERYRYMEEKDYKKLKDQNLLFQMNLLSLVGAYGEAAKKKAEWLIEHDMVDLVGTDIHQLDNVKNAIELSPKKLDYINKVESIVRNSILN